MRTNMISLLLCTIAIAGCSVANDLMNNNDLHTDRNSKTASAPSDRFSEYNPNGSNSKTGSENKILTSPAIGDNKKQDNGKGPVAVDLENNQDNNDSTKPDIEVNPDSLAELDAPDDEKTKKKYHKIGQEILIAGAVVQVNNEYISADEILEILHPQLEKISKNISLELFQKRVASLLQNQVMSEIQQRLVSAEANLYMPEHLKKQIEFMVSENKREMIANAGGSIEKLRQKCAAEGTTIDKALERQKLRITVSIYLRSKFEPTISVNRRMLWKYYKNNPKEFQTEKQVQMQLISFPTKEFLSKLSDSYRDAPSDEQQKVARKLALEKAKLALADLKKGEKFTAVVRNYSRGLRSKQNGIWPMMKAGGKLERKVEDAAFKMKLGQYSDIIEEENGYHIVKVYNIKKPVKVSFEQAQADITSKIKNQQFGKMRMDYLKKIYAKAIINAPRQFYEAAMKKAEKKYRKQTDSAVSNSK